MTTTPYELFYWPTIQGRGEFVRLALEEASAAYTDVARLPEAQGGGVRAMMKVMASASFEPFAPPFLRSGDLVIAQTANILFYLGPRHGLAPADEAGRLHVHQLQLTIADLVGEVHDTHHPVSPGLYYEDQKPEAARRAASFTAERLPKFLGYFERLLERGDGEHLVGSSLTYADLSLFQVLAGLDYAFPKALAKAITKARKVAALRDRIAARPRIAAYLASPRRIPFNEQGIFRRYPELDVAG